MRCAYIEWVDSFHMQGWNDKESIKSVQPEISCGILVQDEAEFVTIALSFAESSNEYGHIISIPKVAIKSIRVFEGGNSKKPRAKRKKEAPEADITKG